MHPHEQLIETFYRAFSKKDFKAMGACYHPEASFRDEVFYLKGKEIAAMWHMLCTRGKDLEVQHSDVEAADTIGSAHWEAWYTFTQTGKKVHNVIEARFTFRDDKIFKHVDSFSFYRWARQAFGFPGILFGWTPYLRNKVQAAAMGNLRKFMQAYPEYA